MRFKNELERNITIKLGYANAKIYARINPPEQKPGYYRAFGSATFLDDKKRIILPSGKIGDPKTKSARARACSRAPHLAAPRSLCTPRGGGATVGGRVGG